MLPRAAKSSPYFDDFEFEKELIQYLDLPESKLPSCPWRLAMSFGLRLPSIKNLASDS